MYAVIESCGKQYKVAEGDVVFFEKLDAEEGKKVALIDTDIGLRNLDVVIRRRKSTSWKSLCKRCKS